MSILFAGRVYFFLKYINADRVSAASAMLRGVRFDLATAATVSGPFLFLLFFPLMHRLKRAARAILGLLLIWFVFLCIYNFIDIQYYDFSHRHLTFEVRNTWQDADAIVAIGLKKYGPEVIGLIFFLFLFSVFFFRKVLRQAGAQFLDDVPVGQVITADIVSLLLIAGISVVLIRGGLQMKPLGIRNAFTDERIELGMLSLNGIYTTSNTLYEDFLRRRRGTLRNEEDARYRGRLIMDERTALRLPEAGKEAFDPEYPLFRRFVKNGPGKGPYNVVIFIMESWSSKYTGALGPGISATPRFDELSRGGLLLTHCFANAQRSIEGMASVLGSMPVYKGLGLGEGDIFYQTRLRPIGGILRRHGYETIFMHGAMPGSMGFDTFARRFGIERVLTRDDFRGSRETDDGVWGIYDEYVFERAHEEFSKMKKPFFGVIYSLSSHTPYSIPSKGFEFFSAEVEHHEFLNSLRYSDYALGRFFDMARKSSYFDRTLFVIVADHAEGASTGGSLFEAYHIPCLFYAPGFLRPGTYSAVSSQLDIVPSVVDLLGLDDYFTAWGASVFGPHRSETSLLPNGDMFVWINGPRMLLADRSGPFSLFDMSKDPSLNLISDVQSRPLAEDMFIQMLSYLGASERLIFENRIMPSEGGLRK